MKKIEIIWRHIIENAKIQSTFTQKDISQTYHLSTSTVHAAIDPLRSIGAIEVTGRNFRPTNLEKILTFWATHRQLQRDLVYETYFPEPVLETEGLIDNRTIYGAYSAARLLLGQSPSDYDKVYLYSSLPTTISERFPKNTSQNPNFFVLKSDPYLEKFGPVTPPSQTYVDLWNLKDWYATDFLKAIKEKFYGFL